MQTFLPDRLYSKSASILDIKRLFNQINEATVILKSLTDKTEGWKNPRAWSNHPATLMWKKYEFALYTYSYWMGTEYFDRTGNSNPLARLANTFEPDILYYPHRNPWWEYDPEIYSSHRAVLLAKNPEWYSQFNWSEEPAQKVNGKWPYKWPMRA